ncbi:MAG: TetR family transcriptional regulator [Ktedonobacterales bacterium]
MNEADPRVKRTRKLLIDAFMQLLATRSFHAISVQDIAERATLNRATFYAHFEDKYALIDYMIRDQFRAALQAHLPDAALFTPGNLRLLVVTVCEFLAQFHGHCAPSDRDVDPRIEAKVQRELHTFLLRWLPSVPVKVAGADLKRETLALLMSWSIFGAGLEWSSGDRFVSADERARQVAAVLIEGVSHVVPEVQSSCVAHAGALG